MTGRRLTVGHWRKRAIQPRTIRRAAVPPTTANRQPTTWYEVAA